MLTAGEPSQAPRLRNLAKHVNKGTLDGERTAKNAFNCFLEYLKKHEPSLNVDVINVEEIHDPEFFSEDIVGRFPDYLLQVHGAAEKTYEKYITHLKGYCQRRYPGVYFPIFEGKKYTDLRGKAKREFVHHAAETGTPMVQHSEKMKPGDLTIFCTILVKANTSKAMYLRCFILLQWHAFGRVSEVTALKWSQFRYWSGDVVRTMQVCTDLYLLA
jgi:integrase